jgi:hypothetical protein
VSAGADSNVPADAGVSENTLLEEEMREIVLREANESMISDSESPFYVPTDNEVHQFSDAQGLDFNAVTTFLCEREEDGWLIRKKDGTTEGVRNWKAFLKAFCEKYECDRR